MLTETIRKAIKSKKAIIGYKKAIRFIKAGEPRLVIVAKNIPEKFRKEIEHNAKISNIKVEEFEGSSKELGVVCGKPFPVTTIAIKG